MLSLSLNLCVSLDFWYSADKQIYPNVRIIYSILAVRLTFSPHCVHDIISKRCHFNCTNFFKQKTNIEILFVRRSINHFIFKCISVFPSIANPHLNSLSFKKIRTNYLTSNKYKTIVLIIIKSTILYK